MKSILLIAYFFPPKGGAGVQRTLKFAYYLNSMGYKVSVLTVKEQGNGIVDRSLYNDISKEIDVYRTDMKENKLIDRILSIMNKNDPKNNSDLQNNSRKVSNNKVLNKIKIAIKNRCKKIFFSYYNMANLPDDKKSWIDFAVNEASRIIESKNIDVIFSTSAPYSSHIIGYKLSVRHSVKWIADFRDPWVNNPFVDNNFIVEIIYKRLEKKVIKKADKVISVSKPIIDEFFKRYKNEDINKFHVITNGYDEKDFENLNIKISNYNEKFIILYNGSLYGNRSPELFLRAIDELIKSSKIQENKVKVKFLGEIGNELKKIVNYYKAKYPKVIEYKNYVPHSESVEQLCKANALLLIINEGKGSEGIYTGKIFEYIRTGKPILGIVPDGVARDLIKDTNTGFVAYPSNQEEIEKMILESYVNFMDSKNPRKPDVLKVKSYSRENLTKELIRIVESIA